MAVRPATEFANEGADVPFVDLQAFAPIEIFPGVRIRTPYGENLMLSYVEIDDGAVVETHRHVHEQGGIVLSGRMELTIGMVKAVAQVVVDLVAQRPAGDRMLGVAADPHDAAVRDFRHDTARVEAIERAGGAAKLQPSHGRHAISG